MILNQLITLFQNLSINGGATIVNDLLNVIFTIMYQYHSLYYTIEISEDNINIKGGPCRWCSSCNTREDIKRYCSAAWCFSSQMTKADIVAIERRRLLCWPDAFPRGYCAPIEWCCCHKSYSGWYFPWCCDFCAKCNLFGCCDGDVYPVCGQEIITFHLSESPTACLFPQRCTLNLWCSCCTYNRISFPLRDPSIIDQLKQAGYQVLEVAGTAGDTTNTGATGGAADTGAGTEGAMTQ